MNIKTQALLFFIPILVSCSSVEPKPQLENIHIQNVQGTVSFVARVEAITLIDPSKALPSDICIIGPDPRYILKVRFLDMDTLKNLEGFQSYAIHSPTRFFKGPKDPIGRIYKISFKLKNSDGKTFEYSDIQANELPEKK